MPKNQAVVFTDKLLPLSQTFVLEQTKHLIDWEAKLIGLESVSNGIDLSSMSSELLFPTGGYFPPRFSSILSSLRRVVLKLETYSKVQTLYMLTLPRTVP
jgi:hypothetical protein